MAADTISGMAEFSTPVESPVLVMNDGRPVKSKGKWLQRISSSPTLAQFSRKRAKSSPYGSRSTLSCISFAPPLTNNSPTPEEILATRLTEGGSSTAPTSGPTSEPFSMPVTPGLDTPYYDPAYRHVAIRRIEDEAMAGLSTLSRDVKQLSIAEAKRPASASAVPDIVEDYFTLSRISKPKLSKHDNFKFWEDMPHEIKLHIFAFLKPKELVRASNACQDFHKTCFDGQLWTCFDASEFYADIPAESLAKIIVSAGPFIKDLNLRGCVQIEHYKRAEVVVKACKNLINATLEGCRNFQKATLHNLLKSNGRLANLNLTGLSVVTNATCKIIAQSCPHLEMFNVSWCTHMDAFGLQLVIEGCPKLKDLRAGEVRGLDNEDLAQQIFETNRLERLVLNGCKEITDNILKIMIHGENPELDAFTDAPMVPQRRLRHLDLGRCHKLTSVGVKSLAHLCPDLEGLQLSGCLALTDSALEGVLATTPRLTHLDLDDLNELTNTLLSDHLAKAPCAPVLQHLSISFCENLGDTGMLPVIRACTGLQNIDMDNTKISDLVLIEAATTVRHRSSRTTNLQSHPRIGLRLVVFDCSNITCTGVREVLSRNSEVTKPGDGSYHRRTFPTEIIALKCFYGWQLTVDEHTKRVLRGDLPAAGRLERKWAEYMMANEEAGAGGAGIRRRRRRAREAQMMHADEEEGGVALGGVGRRRRARSSACGIM
ncbi:putative F-box/LRR-repeat protein 2 [Sclerotinia borealis F-4128]|uniref:Putative F-box/LRR-repeat protein 2 n=1 Tax=Sclerotinia borealis (strain F-4128) TaxID=1432307 RepID=W9CSW2_SCLBF|nr:putative F-box/LRR-repeat protein 2 [Sclerotinia borealis F-4128]